MNRRKFLATSVGALAASNASSAPKIPVGIIDTHTHFYDPARPQGVPWPDKSNPVLYKTTLPDRYLEVTKGQNVFGTVVVEASVWPDDNQWLLDLAKDNPIIVGVVGRLDPAKDDFGKSITSLAKNPLFRGIRLGATSLKPEPLKILVDHDLSLDLLIRNAEFDAALALSKSLPQLRIVIDHLAHPPKGDAIPIWKEALKRAAEQPNIFLKFSGIVESSGIKLPEGAPKDVDSYRESLDAAWETFGEDRLIYGSNWPVSEQFAPYTQVQDIAVSHILEKSDAAAAKVFRDNASKAYKWLKRE
jgi:L-fuconolactonase